MEELKPKLLELWDKIKDPGAYDWEAILDTAIAWAPSAGLFLVGILLGAGLARRKKEKKFQQIDPEADAAAKAAEEAQQRAELTESLRSEFDKKEAQIQGELTSAHLINEQHNDELKVLGDRLTGLQEQMAEKQARVSELAESLEAATSRPGSCAAVLRAQAPIVQLAETVQSESQRIETGIARLERLEASLREQETHLGDCAGEVSQTRARLDHKAQSVPEITGLTTQMDQVDDQLRILHQNLRGCIQRCEAAKSHLLVEKEKLNAAVKPIADAETALAALGKKDGKTEPDAIASALDQAKAKLGEGESLLSELNNGIDQEIAEATGRIEWVVKDSPAKFFAAVEELDADDSSDDLGVSQLATKARRRLGEVRGFLGAVQLALETGAIGTEVEGCGKNRLQEAVARAMTGLETARNTPAPEESPETAKKVEELEKDLAARDEAIKGLKQLIEKDKKALEEGRSNLAARQSELSETQTELETVRKELNHAGPQRSKQEKVVAGLKASIEAREQEKEQLESRLKEREEALEKLADEAPGPERSDFIHKLLGIAGAGAAAVTLTKEEKPDVSPAESLDEAKEALHSLKEAADTVPPETTEPDGKGIAVVPAEEETGEEPVKGEAAFVLASISPGDKVPATTEELVIFRGDDPQSWDSDFNDGSGRLALPLARVPRDIDYLRLRRLDNGDSIVLPITREELLAGGDRRKPRGWCGKVERYFGGLHLGAFDDALPQEVVTRFGAGGWGFGHLENVGAEQAFGWAGQKIDKTLFEISVGHQPAESDEEDEETPEAAVAGGPGESAPDENDAGRIPPEGLIVFCGNDPTSWNQTVSRDANHCARAIADLPDEVTWMRIRRTDTGESVVLPVSKSGLTCDGQGRPTGFNGTNEIFYGARHLGAYDESCPQEIETRFTYGGWGFGHRPVTSAKKESQACGWAGKEIAPDTVFEFTVFEKRPELKPRDRLLTR